MKPLVNYYLILNVSPQASEKEIRLKFLTLAKKYHPDKNKGNSLAEKRFKQINTAYQVLKDSQKRQIFDKKLQAFQQKPVKPSSSPSKQSFKKAPPQIIQKLFKKKNNEKPLDLEVSLPVSIEELCQCATKTLTYMQPYNGKKSKASLTIQIPQGTTPHSVLHFKNKGGSQGTKLKGHLFVKMKLKSHKFFTCKKEDISLDFPIRFIDIIKETSIKIPSPYGIVSTTIPFHAKNHHILRFKGLGLPLSSTKKGNMFVKIIIDYPVGYKVQIQKEMQGLSKKEQKNYILQFESHNSIYKKVLNFEKNLKQSKVLI